MKITLAVGVFGLGMLVASAASAACGSGADGAAMCGKPAKTQVKMSKAAPNATPSSKGMAAGGCACCKDMAMMKDMDGAKDMPKDMPGMAK